MQENQKSGLSWSQPDGAQNAPAGMKPLSTLVPQPVKPEASKNSGFAQTGGTKKLAGVFIAGLVVGALLGWGFVASRSSTESKTETPLVSANPSNTDTAVANVQVDTTNATAAASGLVIPSPQSAGLQVAVSQVRVSAPTWVVIYEDNNGAPGNALGAALFGNSKQSGVVDLLRGTLPGQTYIAGESFDDGDRIFSMQNDKPVRDQNGNPLWVQFKTN